MGFHLASRIFGRVVVSVVALCLLADVAEAQSTWQGTGADSNWSTAGNFDVTPGATGSTLVFDGSTQLTNVNNVVTSTSGITYQATAGAFVSTAASPVTSLTIDGNITNNSAETQTLRMATAISGGRTVSVVENGVMVFGGTGSNFAHTVNSGTSTFTGAGEIRYLSGATGSLTINNGAATSLNMSGLESFVANVGTFRVGQNLNTTPVNTTVRLASSSTITAGSLRVGAGDPSFNSEPLDTLRLGASTTLNATSLVIGQKRNDGTVNFDDNLTNPVVTIRGSGGSGTKAAITLGDYNTTNTARTPTGIADFTGGSVNGEISTLVLGQVNGGSGTTSATGEGRWLMNAGDVAADTVRVGYYLSGSVSGSATTAARGTLTLSGGTFTVNTALRVGDRTAVATVSTSRAEGVVNVSGGSVSVAGSFILGANSGGGVASDQTGTLSITGGLVASSVGLTTNNAQSTLTLNGGTLDMGGNAIGTALQKIGSNGGALTFQSGTLRNVSEINGGDPLVKSGAGTLILAGTSGFTGGTSVNAGTLAVTAVNSLGTGSVTVANGARLRLDVSPVLGGGSVISLLSGAEFVTTGSISAPLATGSSLAGWSSTSAGGTAASLLQSVTSSATTFATGWDTNPGDYLSDILTLDGTTASSSNVMVLSMAYDPSYTGALADLNIFTRPNPSGAFAAVGSSFEGVGVPWTASFQTPGQYGVSEGRVWAVTDTNSQFVVNVTVVPEPASIGLVGCGLAAAAWGLRRRRVR